MTAGPPAGGSPIPTEPSPIELPSFVPAFVPWILDLAPVRTIRVVMDVYGRAGGGLLAAGIAYRVLFALAPAVLLLVAMLGFLVADEATRSAIVETLGELFPPLKDILDSSLAALSAGAVSVTIISLAILLWSASGLYLAIEEGVARMIAFGPLRDPARRTIFGLLAIVVAIGLVIATLVVWSFLDVIGNTFGPEIVTPDVPSPPGRLIALAGAAAIVTLAYRYLPTARPPWSAAGIPGILGGLVIGLLTVLYVLIAPRLAGLAFLYGSLATILVTLAWVGIVSQVLLIGAAWTAVRWSRMRASTAGPDEDRGEDATGQAAV